MGDVGCCGFVESDTFDSKLFESEAETAPQLPQLSIENLCAKAFTIQV